MPSELYKLRQSSADEMNSASPEEKNYVAPTTPDEPDQLSLLIPVRMASLRAHMLSYRTHSNVVDRLDSEV